MAVDNLQVTTANRVPEPTSMALVCLGLVGAGMNLRKGKKQ
ncbi:PEP-CTERM sorting domain-containing protein [Dechloromonas hankyongensis]